KTMTTAEIKTAPSNALPQRQIFATAATKTTDNTTQPFIVNQNQLKRQQS
ncbi:unnamed protein product, partial [Rotaria sp. Silwood2]